MNTHHAWPEKQFDVRVKSRYDDMVRRKMTFPQRLRQRIGTAKALRHVLRIGTMRFNDDLCHRLAFAHRK